MIANQVIVGIEVRSFRHFCSLQKRSVWLEIALRRLVLPRDRYVANSFNDSMPWSGQSQEMSRSTMSARVIAFFRHVKLWCKIQGLALGVIQAGPG